MTSFCCFIYLAGRCGSADMVSGWRPSGHPVVFALIGGIATFLHHGVTGGFLYVGDL